MLNAVGRRTDTPVRVRLSTSDVRLLRRVAMAADEKEAKTLLPRSIVSSLEMMVNIPRRVLEGATIVRWEVLAIEILAWKVHVGDDSEN